MHEIKPLTGIRGFAALWIVLLHFYGSWILLVPNLSAIEPLAVHGALGVDLFFILSGFILSYVYEPRNINSGLQSFGRFAWLRFSRIYPNHLAALLLLLLMVIAAKVVGVGLNHNYPIANLPYELLLLQGWPLVERGMWNYPSWSISAEWFAYLCIFPVCTYALHRRWNSRTCFILGYSILAGWAAYSIDPRLPIQLSRMLQVTCEFAAGCMFFGAYSRSHRLAKWTQHWNGMVCIAIGILLLSRFLAGGEKPGALLLFPLLLMGLASERTPMANFLSRAPVLWLGKISYALYMSHAVSQKFLKISLPAEKFADSNLWIKIAVLAANLATILGLAVALYYCVEIPARNWLKNIRWGRADSHRHQPQMAENRS